MFSLNLYEDGTFIDPLKDERFQDSSIVQSVLGTFGHWANSSFSFSTLDMLLGELIGDEFSFVHLESYSG